MSTVKMTQPQWVERRVPVQIGNVPVGESARTLETVSRRGVTIDGQPAGYLWGIDPTPGGMPTQYVYQPSSGRWSFLAGSLAQARRDIPKWHQVSYDAGENVGRSR